MTIAKFIGLMAFQAILLVGAVFLFRLIGAPLVAPITNAPTEFVNTQNMTAGVMGSVFTIMALLIGFHAAKRVFPSSKPSDKSGQKFLSGQAVLFVVLAGLQVIVTGAITASSGMMMLGAAVAVGGFVFSAPMMGEKARLDHILEAADERADAERTNSGEK